MEQEFMDLLEEVKNDPNIIGFWVGGSRGKGMITEHSDFDCVLIVTDEVFDEYKQKFKARENEKFEFFIKTLQVFRDHANWGTEHAWDRYNYTHVVPLVDKTNGEIAKLFIEKSDIPTDKVHEAVSGYLDAYINQIYRSFKCFRDGNKIASHLEAVESVPWFMSALFGVEGRLKPYYKYLEWELKNYPLKDLPWNTDEFLQKIMTVVQTGNIKTQQELLISIETIMRDAGYGEVFDGWKEKFQWMKTYTESI